MCSASLQQANTPDSAVPPNRRSALAISGAPSFWILRGTRDPALLDSEHALERLVIGLPPKEHACVLLADVFDYSIEDTAEVVGSTVGGVKAALHRGRAKLTSLPAPQRHSAGLSPELHRVLQLYVDHFNRRDWNGVRELISADARLTVVDAFAGRLADAPYFSNYERSAAAWRQAMGTIDGEIVVIRMTRGADTWMPVSAVRVGFEGNRIDSIVDYFHCPWVLPAAHSVVLA